MDISDLLISYKALDKSSISTPTVDDAFTQVEVIPASMLSRASKVAKANEKEEDSEEYSSDFWGFYSKGEDEKPYNNATDQTTQSTTTTSQGSSSEIAANLIKKFEGFHSSRYKDSNGQSIGYGFYGNTYYSGNHITREQADQVLNGIIADNESFLSKFPVWNSLNNNQKAALHSYIYNVGRGKFGKKTKMGQAMRSGNIQAIHDAINITTSNGKRLEGLVRRRNSERNLFNS